MFSNLCLIRCKNTKFLRIMKLPLFTDVIHICDLHTLTSLITYVIDYLLYAINLHTLCNVKICYISLSYAQNIMLLLYYISVVYIHQIEDLINIIYVKWRYNLKIEAFYGIDINNLNLNILCIRYLYHII